MEEKQTHSGQVDLTADLGIPQFPQALFWQQGISFLNLLSPARRLKQLSPFAPVRAERVAIQGCAPPQHLSALSISSAQAAADNMHLHLWPGLPADTADHPSMWALPPLLKNPPQARFHPQATRRAQIFAEYLDT